MGSVASDGAALPAFVLLGADAYVSARPATPVQLMHACREAGYAAAIPTTWGDELIALECARHLAGRSVPPAIFCACRRVRERLLASGPELAPFLVTFVAPPVAAARYLRALYSDVTLAITYVGDCPSGSDAAIDRHVTPKEFFGELAARGIVIERKPLVFDSVFAPDRRRCFSLPGGVPVEGLLRGTRAMLDAAGVPEPVLPRSLVDITSEDYAADVAQYLISQEPVLIDVGARLGCACAGVVAGSPPTRARSSVAAVEPPRSPHPIVDRDVHVDIAPVPPGARDEAAGVVPAALPVREAGEVEVSVA